MPIYTRADALKAGDIVDLENDYYADREGDTFLYEFECQTVCHIKRETPECIAIGFENGPLVGFPPDHMIMRPDGVMHDSGYDS